MPSANAASFLASLVDGEDGATVLERMRLVYKTPQSLRTHTCKLRRSYDGPLDEGGMRVAEEARRRVREVMQAAASKEGATCRPIGEEASRFVEEWIQSYGQARLPPLLLDAEARVQKATSLAPKPGEEGEARLDAPLASLASLVRSSSSLLLPLHVRRLHVDREEVRQCVRAQRDRKLKKAAHATRVDGAALLDEARRVLGRVLRRRTEEGAARRASDEGEDEEGRGERDDARDVLLSLLLVTGRRTCELLNGRSRFERQTRGESEGEERPLRPRGGDPLCDTCVFVGQAKTRSTRRRGYRIPLLAPLSHVLAGMEVVRRRFPPVSPSESTNAGGSRRDRDQIRSNAATTDRYGSSLRGGMRRHPVFGEVGRVHALRGVYVWICYSRFEWGNRWISHVAYEVLGHASLAEAEAYLPLHVEGI